MSNVSFLKRLGTIFSLIASQSFFMTLFMILLMTTSILLLNIKAKSKAPKYAAAIVYVGLAVLVLARYGSYVLSFNDSVVEKFFKAMYFPNIVVYLSMLVITLLLMAITIVDKKFSVVTKICNTTCFFTIWFLFVLVVDSIKKEQLNFYEVKEIYSNLSIMILIQASMYMFVVWFGVIIMDILVRMISDRMDRKDLEKGKPLKPPAKIIDFSKPKKKEKNDLLKEKPIDVDGEKDKSGKKKSSKKDEQEKKKDKKKETKPKESKEDVELEIKQEIPIEPLKEVKADKLEENPFAEEEEEETGADTKSIINAFGLGGVKDSELIAAMTDDISSSEEVKADDNSNKEEESEEEVNYDE